MFLCWTGVGDVEYRMGHDVSVRSVSVFPCLVAISAHQLAVAPPHCCMAAGIRSVRCGSEEEEETKRYIDKRGERKVISSLIGLSGPNWMLRNIAGCGYGLLFWFSIQFCLNLSYCGKGAAGYRLCLS